MSSTTIARCWWCGCSSTRPPERFASAPLRPHNGGGMGVNHPKDEPWLFRTYAGHTSARASNELYKTNLAAGQTRLSVAVDPPPQGGDDSDASRAAGEGGQGGVSITSVGAMRAPVGGHPL